MIQWMCPDSIEINVRYTCRLSKKKKKKKKKTYILKAIMYERKIQIDLIEDVTSKQLGINY